jgi:hypothetical protein
MNNIKLLEEKQISGLIGIQYARKELKSKIGKSVVTGENFLPPAKEKKSFLIIFRGFN